jgi:hypothetical protein
MQGVQRFSPICITFSYHSLHTVSLLKQQQAIDCICQSCKRVHVLEV